MCILKLCTHNWSTATVYYFKRTSHNIHFEFSCRSIWYPTKYKYPCTHSDFLIIKQYCGENAMYKRYGSQNKHVEPINGLNWHCSVKGFDWLDLFVVAAIVVYMVFPLKWDTYWHWLCYLLIHYNSVLCDSATANEMTAF